MHESVTPLRKLRAPSARRLALLAGVAGLGVSVLFAGLANLHSGPRPPWFGPAAQAQLGPGGLVGSSASTLSRR